MIECPSCSLDNSEDSNFCRRCGRRLTANDLSDTTLTYVVPEREDEPGLPIEHHAHAAPVLFIRAGGGREGETIDLALDILIIGRSPENDLFLDDITVSRHHARVLRDKAGYVVEDLNSLNGTYVNRRRIERQRLYDGDELQIGKYKLLYLEETAYIPEEP